MKIGLAQLNYQVAHFEKNISKIVAAIDEAKGQNADLIIFSELSISGYPPLDFLERKEFVDKCVQGIEKIARHCVNIAAIVGGPVQNLSPEGKNLYNAAYFLEDGKVKKIILKSLLPTYDIFDEYRYFESNNKFELVDFKGKKLAVTICEDLWDKQEFETDFGKNHLYVVSPMDELSSLNPDMIINIAASPYSYHRESAKKEIFIAKAKNYKLPVFYVNQVAAQTELIFEGGSLAVSPSGQIFKELAFFEEEISFFEFDEVVKGRPSKDEAESKLVIQNIHDALILGIRDYFSKMNFKKAVLGLSGGIDSAVCLVLAQKALGAGNIKVLLLPSEYSSDHSIIDSLDLVRKLGVEHEIISIEKIMGSFKEVLDPVFKGLAEDITEENLQARIRSVLLMAFSNKFGNILLNTSNKSEAAVGYGTLYGDMSGGLSVLGDVYKTDVYNLARLINQEEEIIPCNIISKPPSAELKPGQKDSDSLPDYSVLDQILFRFIELQRGSEMIIKEGFDRALVKKIIKLVNANEYKRYQAPPVLRISSKAFGSGRRLPLVANYDFL